MLAAMPTGILVVKRPRGGPFAVVRSVPTWLRSFLASGREPARARPVRTVAPASQRSASRNPVDSPTRGRGDASAARASEPLPAVEAASLIERLTTGLSERGARLVVMDDARGSEDSRPRAGSEASRNPASTVTWLVELAGASASATLRWLREDAALAFDTLFDLTIVDRLPEQPRFEVVYSLRSSTTGLALHVRRAIESDPPEADSVVGLWRSADWLEREAWDLFGVRFRAHPGLARILLSADFEGAPLRRDSDRPADPPQAGSS